MRRSKLDDHVDAIKADIAAGASQRDLAKKYGSARSTVQAWLDNNGLVCVGDTAVAPSLDEDSLRLQNEILTAEVRDLRQRARKNHTSDIEFERVLETIREAVVTTPVRYTGPDVKDYDGSPHVQALLLSDLHAGEIVSAEEMNGINEYNWDVLMERMETLQRALLSFQAHRPYPIEELHIWLLGDGISGDIHEELAETNEFPVAEQAWRVGNLMADWIEELLQYFPTIVIHGVPGNHPRLKKKPAAKRVWNSFDWLSYEIAGMKLAGYQASGQVKFDVVRGGQQVVEIAGQNWLLWHGDGVRSSMPGVPWGGVMRRWNELKKTYADQGIHLHGAALGHFHQANFVAGQLAMNGSVKGADEYSLKQFGGGERARQLLLTFNPKDRRLTDVSFLDCQ